MGGNRAGFRFYAELNDFLPAAQRYETLTVSFGSGTTLADVLEAVGVPHSDVDLILANGESVDFFYQLREGDRVAVFPVFESFDISPALRVRSKPLREPRFVLDAHLGALARYLRAMGFNTVCASDSSDDELVEISRDQRRILLTRDAVLPTRSGVTRAYYVRATQPRLQAAEVVRRFDLVDAIAPR